MPNNFNDGGYNSTGAIAVKVAARRHRVFQLRRSGKNYIDIAEIVKAEMPDACPASWGQRAAYLDLQRFLDTMRDEIRESLVEIVDLENQRLDELLAAVWPRAMKGDVRSVEAALKIGERRAKMLGLDEAIKVDWRIELSALLDANVLTLPEIKEQLGDELFAAFMQARQEHTQEVHHERDMITTQHRWNRYSNARQGPKSERGEFSGLDVGQEFIADADATFDTDADGASDGDAMEASADG